MDREVQHGGLICDPRIGEGNGTSEHGDEDAVIAEGVLRHEVRILRENATEGGAGERASYVDTEAVICSERRRGP